MADLIAELEGVVRLSEKATPGPWESASRGRYYVGQQQDEASVHGADDADIEEVSNVAPLHAAYTIRGDCYMPDADLIAAAVNFLRTHHAEIAAAVRDAIPASELTVLLPGTLYMDPPDGGDVTVIEQLRRMAKDAARYRYLRDGEPDKAWDDAYRELGGCAQAAQVDSRIDSAMRAGEGEG